MKKAALILLIVVYVMVLAFFILPPPPLSTLPVYELNVELYGDHYGRDFAGYVGDGKYQMMHYDGYNSLLIMNEPITGSFILDYEYDRFRDENKNFYYYAADGYAVIDPSTNICRVLIQDPPLELVTGEDPVIRWREPENNYRVDKLDGEEYDSIIYLDTFSEFTEKEQRILKKLGTIRIVEEKISRNWFLWKSWMSDKIDTLFG